VTEKRKYSLKSQLACAKQALAYSEKHRLLEFEDRRKEREQLEEEMRQLQIALVKSRSEYNKLLTASLAFTVKA